jgi:glycosyltransferase involved in cell wall biosynthesis
MNPTKISVIIITLNRPGDLEMTSLPSIVNQTYKNFEVIVWDASENDDSKKICSNFAEKHPEIDLRYFKAPRRGLCSQRNDALDEVRGDIIFYIDDDVAVSPDGLQSLHETFKDKAIDGAGLTIRLPHKGNKNVASFWGKITRKWMLLSDVGPRRICLLSGCAILPPDEKPGGSAQWLSGCSQAYRKEVFRNNRFEEKLEKFGGYAVNDELQFSQKLFRQGKKFVIAEKGYAFHKYALGERTSGSRQYAAIFFNQYITWKTAIFPFKRISLFPFLWSWTSHALCLACIDFLHPAQGLPKIRGICRATKAIADDIFLSSHDS